MKIFFYVEFANEPEFSFDRPDLGNPGVGGTEYATISLATELVKRPGIQICILTNFPLRLAAGLELLVVSNLESAMKLGLLDNQFLVFRPKIDPDAPYLESLLTTKAKLIAWTHVTPSHTHLRLLARSRSVAGVVALGNRQALSWVDNPVAKKTVVIQNGQYPAILQADVMNKKKISYLGALVPQKGFHVVAKAWPRVSQEFPELKLQVIGSGNLYDRNTNLGKRQFAAPTYEAEIVKALGTSISSVDFLGRVSAERKAIEIAESFIGIANPTGFTENCPAAALDFQAAGVPVIAGKKYGLIDTVQDKSTGVLIKTRNNLERQIIALIKDDQRRLQYSQNALSFVQKDFNFTQISNQWHEFLRSLEQKSMKSNIYKKPVVNLTERMAIINLQIFRILGSKFPPFSIVEGKTKLRTLQKKILLIFRKS